ncbi:PAS domain-containing protein [Haloterrigena sp. SYSU A558-1]|uniref:histidine kinase n=1 Tax=Haloterrigena gelatinilytica TaxID=2741724 RepID=A0A8J8GN63_9EURY|nr:histidine kinase N-terminal 7TM domain-containing protein [Haloterrigena gelatinilytica]NUB92776.1 PAS domain-containing protein [Haloterrigena gelatinilytica]NUC71310.1 PAS domain-containing protein [Haloterrigena gelatinilytica]
MSAAPGSSIVQAMYAITALNSVILAGVLWRHRDRPGAWPLLGTVLGSGLWTVCGLALMRIDPGPLALALLGLLFLGVGVGTMAQLVFTLEYTGREELIRPPILAALSIEPVLVVFTVIANPRNLFYALSDGTVEWGPAFWIHTTYSYVVLAVVTVLIIEFLVRSRSLYRGQSAALLAGTLAAWVGNAAYVFGAVDVDVSPIGFAVAGILYAVAILRYQLVDVVPIARDRVLDTVTDAVFVVDDEDRLIDANPVGRRLLACVDGSPIGTGVDSLLADRPALGEEVRALTATRDPAERELAVGDDYYLVRTTPIEDGRDRHAGWLFVAREITERKRRETRLERQNERLAEFANIVSHDLRNPLTVAGGHLQLAREADDPDPHLDEIERSHERMETIIEDVLALAREGRDVTDTEPVDLAALADRAWASVDTGDATLAIDSSAPILADPDRLWRLLENLFRNSLEHGTDRADGADLEVAVGTLGDARDGSGAGFYVADDGVGIPSSQCDRVFESGYTTDGDGTGFGLSIVEEIATAHDWTSAVAESDAGGARFEFRGVEPAGDATPADADVGSDESSIGTDPSRS